MESGALLSERFRVVSCLGEGAYGAVYEAVDTVGGERVAVKVLHRLGAEAVFRFKQEFRCLRDLRHPNLAELGELMERDGRWLFTMELVRGTDLLSYVRPRPSGLYQDPNAARARGLDEARLRQVLVQLAAGLNVLHREGKIHRDIKPSNVRVSEQGRVVLLDFGLIKSDADESGSAAASIVGTAAYMSPEQAAGAALSPASDWYSVGVLVYEALTGRRPFTGSALQILFDKQRQQPAAPSALVEDVPADLESLCMALLQVSAGARPDGAEVLRRMGSGQTESGFGARQGIVGREAQRRCLDRAFDALVDGGSASHIYVGGESGVGKTSLIWDWAERLALRESQVLVLRGGCRQTESVPFRAFDGVIDALSRALLQMPDAELETMFPAQLGALRAVFPVLGRIDLIARTTAAGEGGAEPGSVRQDAFAALRAIFSELARRRPLVVVLDDLQWADQESITLIQGLLEGPGPPRFLVVAAGSSVDCCPAPVRHLLETTLCPDGAGLLELGALALDEGTRLARTLLSHESHGWPERAAGALAGQIARSAEGHPVFISLIVRYGAGVPGTPDRVPGLEAVLRHRVGGLRDEERQVLQLVAVAGGSLTLAILRQATGLRRAGFRKAVSALLGGGLVTEVGFGNEVGLAIVQERIRDAILLGLGNEDRVLAHRMLADAYLAAGASDAEALSVHLGAAGDVDEAVHFALIAAGSAFDAFAFDRASQRYQLAIQLLPPDDARRRRRTLSRYADALEGAGRGIEAARANLRAIHGAPPLEAAELRVRVVRQLVQCGHLEAAREHMEDLLRGARLSPLRTTFGAMLQLGYERLRLRVRGLSYETRGAMWITPEELHQIDALWTASNALSTWDAAAAADLQTQMLRLALNLGEPYRLARAMASEAQRLQSLEPRPLPALGALFAKARLLAQESRHPHAHAVVSLGEGAAAHSVGRFGQALAKLEEAEHLLRGRCRGVALELATVQYLSLTALQFVGRLAEVQRRVPPLLKEARAQGDRYLESLIGTSVGYWQGLCTGDAQGALATVRESRSNWPREGGQLQDSLVCVAYAYISMCLEPGQAFERVETAYKRVNRRAVAQSPALRVLLTSLRVQAELCSDVHGGATSGDAWSAARRGARLLQREPLGYGPAFGHLIEAAWASHCQDEPRALSLLGLATAGFQAHEMNLYVWAARYREAQLLGGQQGEEQRQRAVRWVEGQGVLVPEALLRALASGFRH